MAGDFARNGWMRLPFDAANNGCGAATDGLQAKMFRMRRMKGHLPICAHGQTIDDRSMDPLPVLRFVLTDRDISKAGRGVCAASVCVARCRAVAERHRRSHHRILSPIRRRRRHKFPWLQVKGKYWLINTRWVVPDQIRHDPPTRLTVCPSFEGSSYPCE